MNESETVNKRPRKYQRHGLTQLKAAVKGLGGRAIDRRTVLGKALGKWRSDLISDRGGKDNLSVQQITLVDLAVKSKLMLDSIDAWILVQPSLVNSRKKSLYPVVLQRQTLADALARYLAQLGLERKVKTLTLAELLNEEK
jgi:hypothetical protein